MKEITDTRVRTTNVLSGGNSHPSNFMTVKLLNKFRAGPEVAARAAKNLNRGGKQMAATRIQPRTNKGGIQFADRVEMCVAT